MIELLLLTGMFIGGIVGAVQGYRCYYMPFVLAPLGFIIGFVVSACGVLLGWFTLTLIYFGDGLFNATN